MAENKSNLIIDTHSARWFILILIAFTLFSAYFFVEMISPLRSLLQSHYWWTDANYSFFNYSKYFLTLSGFLLLGGIFLDKFGIRFAGFISLLMMIGGASLFLFALSSKFINGHIFYDFLKDLFPKIQPSLIIACIGFAIFGLGIELIGITAIRIVIKWFKGKELGFAIGLLISFSRLGAAFAFMFSANFAGFREVFGLPHGNLMNPVYFGNSLLFIAFLTFLTLILLDKNYDLFANIKKSGSFNFKLKDLLLIFQNTKLFLFSICFVAIYSILEYFTNYLTHNTYLQSSFTQEYSMNLYAVILFVIILFAPIAGKLYDNKMNIKHILIVSGILLFFGLSLFFTGKDSLSLSILGIFFVMISFTTISTSILSHFSFIVNEKNLGYAYACLFWLQSLFLVLFSFV